MPNITIEVEFGEAESSSIIYSDLSDLISCVLPKMQRLGWVISGPSRIELLPNRPQSSVGNTVIRGQFVVVVNQATLTPPHDVESLLITVLQELYNQYTGKSTSETKRKCSLLSRLRIGGRLLSEPTCPLQNSANSSDPPHDPSSLDAITLSHSHSNLTDKMGKKIHTRTHMGGLLAVRNLGVPIQEVNDSRSLYPKYQLKLEDELTVLMRIRDNLDEAIKTLENELSSLFP